MSYHYNGIGQVCASFHCESDLKPGTPVISNRHDTVTMSGEDQEFIGVVVSVKNKIACVAVSGFVTVPYSGQTPSVGMAGLSGDNTGCVMLNEETKRRYIVSVDTSARTITILL